MPPTASDPGTDIDGTPAGPSLRLDLRRLDKRPAPDTAPLLLWLHGFLGTAADWEPLAAALPGYRHLALTLPGHGGAPLPADSTALSVLAVADALAAALRAYTATAAALGHAPGPPRVGVIGYSLGGRVAIGLAARHPALIAALVLESTQPGLPDAAERAARLAADQALAERLASSSLPDFLRGWYAMPLFQGLARDPAALDALIARRAAVGDPGRLAAAMRALSVGGQPDWWPALPSFAWPTLLLAGADDTKYAALAPAMAACVPRADVEIVPGCSHTIHAERPAEWLARVRPWLAAHFPPAPSALPTAPVPRSTEAP